MYKINGFYKGVYCEVKRKNEKLAIKIYAQWEKLGYSNINIENLDITYAPDLPKENL